MELQTIADGTGCVNIGTLNTKGNYFTASYCDSSYDGDHQARVVGDGATFNTAFDADKDQFDKRYANIQASKHLYWDCGKKSVVLGRLDQGWCLVDGLTLAGLYFHLLKSRLT